MRRRAAIVIAACTGTYWYYLSISEPAGCRASWHRQGGLSPGAVCGYTLLYTLSLKPPSQAAELGGTARICVQGCRPFRHAGSRPAMRPCSHAASHVIPVPSVHSVFATALLSVSTLDSSVHTMSCMTSYIHPTHAHNLMVGPHHDFLPSFTPDYPTP